MQIRSIFLGVCFPRYIKASDGNMAEGSLRLDVNVSLRPKGVNARRKQRRISVCVSSIVYVSSYRFHRTQDESGNEESELVQV
jgi:Asp-tRNA(Asn)/Glu-tRNA(Gln) amidotransferase B subunit